MEITSTKNTLNYAQETVFNYLLNLNNIQHLLPQGKFSDWKATEDKCSFKMQGYTLELEKKNAEPHHKITLGTPDNSSVPLDLHIHLTTLSAEKTEVYLHCQAQVNAFLKMMLNKPLTNLFDHMIKHAGEVKMGE